VIAYEKLEVYQLSLDTVELCSVLTSLEEMGRTEYGHGHGHAKRSRIDPLILPRSLHFLLVYSLRNHNLNHLNGYDKKTRYRRKVLIDDNGLVMSGFALRRRIYCTLGRNPGAQN